MKSAGRISSSRPVQVRHKRTQARTLHRLVTNPHLKQKVPGSSSEAWREKATVGSRETSQRTEESSAIDTTDRGYFFFSPSKEDCGNQEALECQAMTLGERRHSCMLQSIQNAMIPPAFTTMVFIFTHISAHISHCLPHKPRNIPPNRAPEWLPFRSNYRLRLHRPISISHYCLQPMLFELCWQARLSLDAQGNAARGTNHRSSWSVSVRERRTATVLKHHMKSLSSASTSDVDKKDKDRAYVIPTGSLFVSETVVKGVLPQVLDEILATRAMLKRAAKTYKKHVPNVAPSILRSLEAKQLALKYVANVTYGTFLDLLRSQQANELMNLQTLL